VLSGAPASDPSPHLISMECRGVLCLVDDFEKTPERNTAIVQKLAMKKIIAVMNFIWLVEFKNHNRSIW